MTEIGVLIAEGKFLEAINKLEILPYDDDHLLNYVQLAELYLATDQTEKGKHILSRIIHEVVNLNSIPAICKATIIDVSSSLKDGSFKTALERLNTQIHLFSQLDLSDDLQKKIMGSYHNIKAVYLGQMGEVDQSEKEGRTAIKYFTELNDQTALTRLTYNLGTLFSRMNIPVKGIEFLDMCNKSAISAGNELFTAYSNMELGAIYQNIGKLEKAIECFTTQYTIFQAIGNDEQKAWAYSDLGNGMRGIGEIEQSLDLLMKGLEIYERGDDKRTLANHLTYLAENHKIQGNMTICKNYYLKALELYENLQEDEMIVKTQIALIDVNVMLGQYELVTELTSQIDLEALKPAHKLDFWISQTKLILIGKISPEAIILDIHNFEIPKIQLLQIQKKKLLLTSLSYAEEKQVDFSTIQEILAGPMTDFRIHQTALLWQLLHYLLQTELDSTRIQSTMKEIEDILLKTKTNSLITKFHLLNLITSIFVNQGATVLDINIRNETSEAIYSDFLTKAEDLYHSRSKDDARQILEKLIFLTE